MANKILPFFDTEGTFTITLASLASSAVGVGRQSTMIDNSLLRYRKVHIFGKITQGTSPTGSTAVYVYKIKGDKNGTAYRSDGAGASDAAITVLNSKVIEVGSNLAAPSTGDVIWIDCIIEDPGPEFGICVVNSTGVALNATAGNHYLRYTGEDPEVQ